MARPLSRVSNEEFIYALKMVIGAYIIIIMTIGTINSSFKNKTML